MAQDIHVLIVEDDLYARDLMALLLTRDWRTRVIGEVSNEEDIPTFLKESDLRVDVIVLDTEIPDDDNWPFGVIEDIRSVENPPKILYLGTTPNVELLGQVINEPEFGGYALKGEILYGLAAGIALVSSGMSIVSSGIKRAAWEKGISLPEKTKEVDGSTQSVKFTRRESEVVRLAILFNMAMRDVADELVLSTEWASEIVSHAYTKLGLKEIKSGEVPLSDYFDDPAILARWNKVIPPEGVKSRKAPWTATLAYHILTMPKVSDV